MRYQSRMGLGDLFVRNEGFVSGVGLIRTKKLIWGDFGCFRRGLWLWGDLFSFLQVLWKLMV